MIPSTNIEASLKEIFSQDLPANIVMASLLNDFSDGKFQLESIVQIMADLCMGKTIADGVGLSEQELAGMKSIADGQYKSGRYAEALKIYSFLLILDHLNIDLMKIAAQCLQNLGLHEEAIERLAGAHLIDPNDAEAAVMTAESMIHLGKRRQAAVIIERVINLQVRTDLTEIEIFAVRKAKALRELLATIGSDS